MSLLLAYAEAKASIYVSFWESSASAWTDGLGCLTRAYDPNLGPCGRQILLCCTTALTMW